MDKIPQGFLADIEAVMTKHGITDIRKANSLGQVIEQMDECCVGNSVPWALEGMMFSYAFRGGAIKIVKDLVEALGEKHLNYNDMDANMWARRIVIQQECLTCSSLVSKLDKKNPAPKKEDCTRCNGTGIDPEFHNDAWILVYDDHGNGKVFIVEETCCDYHLHIRDLPYNESREKRIEVLERLVVEVPKDKYDSHYDLIRFEDNRDKGFVLSLEYSKAREGLHEEGEHHDCEASLRAPFAISCILEHFPCVIEDELGVKPKEA